MIKEQLTMINAGREYDFQLNLDWGQAEYLLKSLKVILHRQLNSIAKLNMQIESTGEKIQKLRWKIDAGKKGIFQSNEEKLEKLKEKLKQLRYDLAGAIISNRDSRDLYISLLKVFYGSDTEALDICLKTDKNILVENRDYPSIIPSIDKHCKVYF